MNRIALILFVTLFTTIGVCGQSIEIRKVPFNYKYFQNGKRLNRSKLTKALAINEEASAILKKSKGSFVFSQILGGIGGFLAGWQIGAGYAGGETNWTMAAVGVGIAMVSIPFSLNATKKTKEAVTLFNSSQGATSYKESKPIFHLKGDINGLGLRMSF